MAHEVCIGSGYFPKAFATSYVMAYFHTLEDKYGKNLIYPNPDQPNEMLMPTKSALYAVPVIIGVLLNNGPKIAEDLNLDQLKI